MDEALRVSDQLRSSGRVSRGRIGVQIEAVSKEVAESIGLGKPQGALVRAVETGSPAEKAGVEAGDIITRYEGKVVEKVSDLPRMVGSTKPGTKASLTVFRRGSTRDLTVTIAEVEAEGEVTAKAKEGDTHKGAEDASRVSKQWGLVVAEVTPEQVKELKLKGGGVRVVQASEAAARAGLRQDDVIVALANIEVRTLKDFEAAIAKADKNKPLNVLFRRGDWAQYTLIRPAR